MLIHFVNHYSILGRIGDKLRIQGMFPGIQVDDYIFLNEMNIESENDICQKFRIEKIEYAEMDGGDYFGAVIIPE